MSPNIRLGFNVPRSPCPKALCVPGTILHRQDIRSKFKRLIMEIKQEAYRKIQQLSGGIENIKRKYPFQYLLFSEFSYSFTVQRSLITTLGQKHVPNLLKFLVEKRGYKAETNCSIEIVLSKEIFQKIDEIVANLRSGKRMPNARSELTELIGLIMQGQNKENMVKRRLTLDLYIENPKNPRYSYYIEIKTPRPKLEDCDVTKRRLLLFRVYKYKTLIESGIKAEEAFEEALYSALIGFYYNPFDKSTEEIRRTRKYPHTFFNRLFELNEALIAEELWDCLGGMGTYDELVKIIEEVVKEFKQQH